MKANGFRLALAPLYEPEAVREAAKVWTAGIPRGASGNVCKRAKDSFVTLALLCGAAVNFELVNESMLAFFRAIGILLSPTIEVPPEPLGALPRSDVDEVVDDPSDPSVARGFIAGGGTRSGGIRFSLRTLSVDAFCSCVEDVVAILLSCVSVFIQLSTSGYT